MLNKTTVKKKSWSLLLIAVLVLGAAPTARAEGEPVVYDVQTASGVYVSPINCGIAGAAVTITGNNFTDISKVTFSDGETFVDIVGEGFTVENTTQISTTVPEVLTDKLADVTVTSEVYGESSPVQFTCLGNDRLVRLWNISGGYWGPSFGPLTTSYTTKTAIGFFNANLGYELADPNATITFNGTAGSNGSGNKNTSVTGLNPGANTVDIVVTAPGGGSSKTYTVTAVGPPRSINPSGDTIDTAAAITIDTSGMTDGECYYTVTEGGTGTAPTTDSQKYTGSFTIGASGAYSEPGEYTVQAAVYAAGIMSNAIEAKFTVTAEGGPGSDVCAIGGVGYSTLDAALAVEGETKTITLLTDIDYNSGITIDGKTVIFNLAGCTLNITTPSGNGLDVKNGGKLLLHEPILGELNVNAAGRGVNVTGSGSEATVTTATGGAYGANAESNGKITVLGDCIATENYQTECGARAVSGGNITIGGDAVSKHYGAYAEHANSSITVFGDAIGDVDGAAIGVYATLAGNIIVKGDVKGKYVGVQVGYGSEITIDGTISTVDDSGIYIRIGNVNKTIEDYEASTTKDGYRTYRDAATAQAFVWVKDGSPPSPAHTVTAEAATLTPVAGVANVITLTVKNSSGDIDTTFTGAHEVTLSGAQVMTGGSNCGFFASYGIPTSGTLTADAIFEDGVATPHLSLFKAGLQTISFSVAGVTNPSASVDFTVVPRTPGSMSLTQDITAPAVNGGQFATQPVLELKDAYANLCTNDSTTQVTASKHDSGSWVLTGNTTVTAVNGVVTFTNLGATNTEQVTGAQLAFTANDVSTSTSAAVTLPAPTGSWDVCKIGEVGYATLEEALDHVKDNETITLLQSISYSEPIEIDGKTITFDLGSFDLNIDTSATAGSTGLTATNGGKVGCSGSGKLDVTSSQYGVIAQNGSEIHVSGSVTAGQYGVTTSGSGNPKVTVDGDVTVTGQVDLNVVDAVSAGGYATVEIGGHVTANRTKHAQNVTAVYSNGSTVTVGKNVTTQGSGVNVQNDGEVTIDGVLNYNPTGAVQSYIKLGIDAAGVKTADDYEDTSTKPGYKEYKNGNNIVWIKDAGTTYSVTVNGSYASSSGAGSYAEGATVSINSGNRTGYTFTGWTSSDVTITNAGNKAASFTMPAKNVTVTANWSYKGGGSSGSPKPPKPTYNADVKEGTGSETTLPVTVNKNKGTASTDAGSGILSSGETIVTMPSITGVGTYSIGIPVPDLSTSEVQGTLTLHTDNGIITVPSNMLTGVPGISGNKAQISIGQGDKTTLPEDVKAAIGNRPLVRLALSIDRKKTNWFNPGAPVTVSIPYTPTAAELANPESIVVWYIDGSGNAVAVPSGRYDPATGFVTFTTAHFSNYAVVCVTKTFDDLGRAEWARKPIEVLASKGILRGISEAEYAPGTNITRADFLCFLIRTLGVDAKFDGNFDDIHNSAYYYREIGIARELGITNGTGDNKFNPDESVTRQDMMVLTERILRMLNKIKAQGTASDLDMFSDRSLIAAYAVDGVASVVKEGLIIGSGGKINPLGNTTRAEAAVFLYRIYNTH